MPIECAGPAGSFNPRINLTLQKSRPIGEEIWRSQKVLLVPLKKV